jgi:hypothetical protein
MKLSSAIIFPLTFAFLFYYVPAALKPGKYALFEIPK